MLALPTFRPRANRFVGSKSVALPGEDAAINPGHRLSSGLAFFFIPTATGFRDLVRGDTMTFSGTVTPAGITPFGPGWVFGSAAGSVQGSAQTAGGDKYYQPPGDGSGKIHISLACGAWNQAAIVNANTACYLRWGDSASGNAGNAAMLQLRNAVGVPRMIATITVAGSNTDVLSSGGSGITMDTALNGMTYCGTYDNANGTAAYSSTSLGFGSGTSAKTTTPTGMDRVVIGDPSSSFCPNRVVLWVAGWFTVLSTADTQWLVGYNGGVPPGLLIQRTPRLYSFAPPGGSFYVPGKSRDLRILAEDEEPATRITRRGGGTHAAAHTTRPLLTRVFVQAEEDEAPRPRRRLSSSHGFVHTVPSHMYRVLTRTEEEPGAFQRRISPVEVLIPASSITMRTPMMRLWNYDPDEYPDEFFRPLRPSKYHNFEAPLSGISDVFHVKAEFELCGVEGERTWRVAPDLPIRRR